ncbi:MAG: cyclophilin-like fold protein [Chloroflexota bacterium]|nr:cyclophilin-like fold protein [Chloroflexota bacterium]
MPKKIRITAGNITLDGELNDTKTAQAIWAALPIVARGNRWGDEIYFGIGVQSREAGGQEVVAVGDLAYWPPGNAFCIFFGPTPASSGSEPRAASAVIVVGKLAGDAKQLTKVPSGAQVTIEKAV